MIFLSTVSKYEKQQLPSKLQEVLDYLEKNNFLEMEPGVYEIEGKTVYAQVFDTVTDAKENKRPESHYEYIDVQYLASGEELLGFTPLKNSFEADEYIAERDIVFYNTIDAEGFIHATQGCVSIFFPSDVHRPGVSAGAPATIRKVVVKVHKSAIYGE